MPSSEPFVVELVPYVYTGNTAKHKYIVNPNETNFSSGFENSDRTLYFAITNVVNETFLLLS